MKATNWVKEYCLAQEFEVKITDYGIWRLEHPDFLEIGLQQTAPGGKLMHILFTKSEAESLHYYLAGLDVTK